MSTQPNPFDITSYDLGDNKTGIDRLGVDRLFSNTHNNNHICLICSKIPKYRLIPKQDHLATAEIQDRGFICAYCIQQGYIDPDDYGLREL